MWDRMAGRSPQPQSQTLPPTAHRKPRKDTHLRLRHGEVAVDQRDQRRDGKDRQPQAVAGEPKQEDAGQQVGTGAASHCVRSRRSHFLRLRPLSQ